MGAAALGDLAMDDSGQGPQARGCRDRRLGGEQGTNGHKQGSGHSRRARQRGSMQGTWARLAGGARQGRLGGGGGGGGGGRGGEGGLME